MKVQVEKGTERLIGGFLNIDKPAGWTSHDVVAKIRGLLRIRRVGHLGTLDPQATGVLPICFGKGTKLASFLSDADKAYDTVLRLGEETDTEDATGNVTRSVAVPGHLKGTAAEAEIKTALLSFVGTYMQEPPMYSAVKINGAPLYKAARRGEVVQRPLRSVTIRDITFMGVHGADVAFRVTCSKGTYIRTLCADIGRRLEVGGHLLSLRRTRAGDFHIDDAVELDAFAEQCETGEWRDFVWPLNRALGAFPALWVKGAEVKNVLNGVQIGFEGLEKWDPFEKGMLLRFLNPEGNLIAVGHAQVRSVRMPLMPGQTESPFKIKTVLRA
ncbi:MAG: tRNA pseudouridine(55) synthase TruB [Nitrospiria bacterium]